MEFDPHLVGPNDHRKPGQMGEFLTQFLGGFGYRQECIFHLRIADNGGVLRAWASLFGNRLLQPFSDLVHSFTAFFWIGTSSAKAAVARSRAARLCDPLDQPEAIPRR